MDDKKTMTLNLSGREMAILDQIADRKGISKTAIVRQALRLYQSIEERLENGDKLFVEKPSTREKSELMVL